MGLWGLSLQAVSTFAPVAKKNKDKGAKRGSMHTTFHTHLDGLLERPGLGCVQCLWGCDMGSREGVRRGARKV